MLAFIGGLFAGIFGIFPFGKKSEYLLEFDNADKTSTPKQESTQASVAAEPTTTETEPASYETPKEAKAEPTNTQQTEKMAGAPAVEKEIKAPEKTNKVELQKSTTPQVVIPEATITNDTTSQKLKEEVVLFATEFLMPQPTPKRVPGPSMSMFIDITKSMDLPR